MTDTPSLTHDQRQWLLNAISHADEALRLKRAAVVSILHTGVTFREVAEATGLSTNTLQRWKREASR